ncbi:MAG TPA: hypothetical protein V6C78_11415 [Crinalium sp.]|jgi:hypothetical protein
MATGGWVGDRPLWEATKAYSLVANGVDSQDENGCASGQRVSSPLICILRIASGTLLTTHEGLLYDAFQSL